MAGRPFARGNQVGQGRPRGSRNRATVFQEALERDGETIIEEIKRQALKSDPTAMRLCMERLVPVAKAPNARLRLTAVDTAASLAVATAEVARAVAEGRLSGQEGESVARIIETQRRNLEAGDFDARLRMLEEDAGKRRTE